MGGGRRERERGREEEGGREEREKECYISVIFPFLSQSYNFPLESTIFLIHPRLMALSCFQYNKQLNDVLIEYLVSSLVTFLSVFQVFLLLTF